MKNRKSSSASLSLAYRDNFYYPGRFLYRYDIVDLYYYNEPGRTKSIGLNNLQKAQVIYKIFII
ncbi:hypothetical protein EMIT079MI2_230034 [Bacillus sp. IT-79MI2]